MDSGSAASSAISRRTRGCILPGPMGIFGFLWHSWDRSSPAVGRTSFSQSLFSSFVTWAVWLENLLLKTGENIIEFLSLPHFLGSQVPSGLYFIADTPKKFFCYSGSPGPDLLLPVLQLCWWSPCLFRQLLCVPGYFPCFHPHCATCLCLSRSSLFIHGDLLSVFPDFIFVGVHCSWAWRRQSLSAFQLSLFPPRLYPLALCQGDFWGDPLLSWCPG